MFWVKNTSGKPDAMLTFAVVSFAVVTLNLFLSTFAEISVFGHSFTLAPLDSGTLTAYLGATFTAYVTRRWTDKRYSIPSEKSSNEDSK